MKKHVLILFLLAAVTAVSAACDSLPFVASNSPTETPSRTPRPTFTPRSAATNTPSDTETAAVTNTVQPTDTQGAQATDITEPPTAKPVAKATRPPAPPQPTAQPPAPTFPVHPDFGGAKLCPQDGIYEVVIYVKQDGSAGNRPFAGGLFYGVFSGGQLLKFGDGKDMIGTTDTIPSTSYGSNCNAAYDRLHPNQINGKLDVTDAVRRGTTVMQLRFVRSPTDLTAISADVNLDFSTAGRWWAAFGYSGG